MMFAEPQRRTTKHKRKSTSRGIGLPPRNFVKPVTGTLDQSGGSSFEEAGRTSGRVQPKDGTTGWQKGVGTDRLPTVTNTTGITIGTVSFTPAAIFRRLQGIAFFKDELAQRLRVRDQDEGDDPLAWGKRIEMALASYAKHKAGDHKDSTNNAMSIAIRLLEGVGRVVATNVLYDPGLTSQCSTQLLELYSAEIKQALGPMKKAKPTMKLAKALVSDDPVSMFIHGEITKERAGERVRAMALSAWPVADEDVPAAAREVRGADVHAVEGLKRRGTTRATTTPTSTTRAPG